MHTPSPAPSPVSSHVSPSPTEAVEWAPLYALAQTSSPPDPARFPRPPTLWEDLEAYRRRFPIHASGAEESRFPPGARKN